MAHGTVLTQKFLICFGKEIFSYFDKKKKNICFDFPDHGG